MTTSKDVEAGAVVAPTTAAAAASGAGLHQRHATQHASNGDVELTVADQQQAGAATAAPAALPPNKDADTAVASAVAADGAAVEEAERPYADVTYMDILKQFSLLGWTAFGGPSAHIGLFERVGRVVFLSCCVAGRARARHSPLHSHPLPPPLPHTHPTNTPPSPKKQKTKKQKQRLVDRFRWISHDVYGELFALGQCMPGPTSTQVSFALGIVKKGTRGGLLSGALFQWPGAVIMTAVGVGAAAALENPSGWLNGLTAGVSAVGVALVASAAKAMAGKLCSGPLLASISAVATVVAYYWPKAYTFPCLILAGGAVTLAWAYYKRTPVPAIKVFFFVLFVVVSFSVFDCMCGGTNIADSLTTKKKKQKKADDASVRSHGLNMWWGGALLALWAATLIASVVLVGALGAPPFLLQLWEAFYRTGSIIYGGGQVVLPMLYTGVVTQTCDAAGVCADAPGTWVTSKQFYAGLGVVQALPGPLFNFSAYLGTIAAINMGYTFIVGALLAWFGLFLPGGCFRVRVCGAAVSDPQTNQRLPSFTYNIPHKQTTTKFKKRSKTRHHDHLWHPALLGQVPVLGAVPPRAARLQRRRRRPHHHLSVQPHARRDGGLSLPHDVAVLGHPRLHRRRPAAPL